tara:strand:+ start:4630 stop:4980 length:351 start_codon:yes stop_codon:yes gene_type:complete
MANQVTVLKVPSYKMKNKPAMARVLVDFICILKNIRMSETEAMVLSHFMVEGYSQITKEQIISGKLLKNKSSLANTLTVFRKNGILVKESFREVLAPDFRYPISDKIKIDITLDNS